MNHVDQRINEVEAEVVGLKVAVNAIDEKIDRQTQVITDIVRNERSSPSTQIAFSALFLSAVIFYNNLTIQPVTQSIEYNKAVASRESVLITERTDADIQNIGEQIDSLWHYLEKHEAGVGHATTLRDGGKLDTRISVLESKSHLPTP